MNLSKQDLLKKCQELGITKCKSKKKDEIIKLLEENIDLPKIINEEKEDTTLTSDKIRMIDLFAGTGAFSYAFHKTNKVMTIFANDFLETSESIFNLNNITKLKKKDLNSIKENEIPEFEILTAGFPCQPFSIAGMQKGFEDERSNVFWKIISIIKTHNPKIVLLENVKNLQSHDNGNTFKVITNNLIKLGYHIKHKVINTCKITPIPQNRERIYIVCFKDQKLCDKFNLDFEEVENEPIIHFLEETIPEKYYYNNSTVIYEELKKNITKNIVTNTIYQYRRYYVRENKNNVCPTLTANMGGGGHNVPIILDNQGIRKLTPRECFNLQGFPKDYKLPLLSDSKLYSLAGNAVSIPVISLIANQIMKVLE